MEYYDTLNNFIKNDVILEMEEYAYSYRPDYTCYDMDKSSKRSVMWKKSHKRSHIVWFHLWDLPGIGKSIATESRLLVARDWDKDGVTANGYRVSFWVMTMFCN